MKKAPLFFSKQEQEQLVNAIQEAERNTSGEIRIHIENKCKGDVILRAKEVFEQLKMHQTELKNGVLFYLAIQTKDFAILGDKGINECVPADFWQDVTQIVLAKFKENQFTEGLSSGILLCGEKLKHFFPYQKEDINELPDEISFES
jgi:uncharacterized membrane protein